MTEQLTLFTFSVHCSIVLKLKLGISGYVITLSIGKTYSFPSLDLPSYPGDTVIKNLPEMQEATCNVGDLGLIPGLGKSPEEGNGNPLQYSCIGNCMEREASWVKFHGIAGFRHNLGTKPPLLSSSNKSG